MITPNDFVSNCTNRDFLVGYREHVGKRLAAVGGPTVTRVGGVPPGWPAGVDADAQECGGFVSNCEAREWLTGHLDAVNARVMMLGGVPRYLDQTIPGSLGVDIDRPRVHAADLVPPHSPPAAGPVPSSPTRPVEFVANPALPNRPEAAALARITNVGEPIVPSAETEPCPESPRLTPSSGLTSSSALASTSNDPAAKAPLSRSSRKKSPE